MHTIEEPKKKIRIEIPQEWNEMTSTQVEYIFKLYTALSKGGINIGDFKARIVSHFIQFKVSTKTITKQLNGNHSELAETIIHLYDTLFDYILIDYKGVYSLNYDSPIQFFPLISNIKGPGTLLSDMTYGDFITCCSFLTTIDEFGVDSIIRNLYKGIDIRMVYQWQKAWVLMWFRSCVSHISNGSICVDGRDVNFSVLFSSGRGSSCSSGIVNTDPWRTVMYIVAESGAFGDVEAVKKAELYDVLMYLLKLYSDAKDKRN